jgi:uncharacterized surface protein with fasciclin (FAS1) repeats
MKLTSLSKAARALVSIAALSTIVGLSISKTAQAQTTVPTSSEEYCSSLTSDFTYSELRGIEFTPQQKAANQRFFDEAEVKNQAVIRNPQFASTPEKDEEIDKINRNVEVQTLSVLTPEQQKVYQNNLIIKRALEDCDRFRQSKMKRLAAIRAARSTQRTVVDIAVNNASFIILVEAVKAAGLVETLSSKGPFTLFAPTNEAFAALPKGTVEKLLKPENRKTLQKILTYHVVSGNVLSENLKSGRVATVEGNQVAVRVQNGKIKVNNANVVLADLKGSSGVVHMIDRVLLPPNLKL